MEGVGGSAGFADRTAHGTRLRSYGLSQDVYAGKDLGVQTSVGTASALQEQDVGGHCELPL